MPFCHISVADKALTNSLYYKGQAILSYTVRYPFFYSMKDLLILDQLNAYYSTKAMMYIKKDIVNLYQRAMVDYEYSVANDFPVRPYEVLVGYQVTYNRDCILSLYFDRYEYTGGAHGSTVRTSDSWNIACSRPLTLMDLFPPDTNVRQYIIDRINEQIQTEAQYGSMIYFDDYENLVEQYLNLSNFYLTEDGIVIFFQQYDIAPYSTGIPEFLIPYAIEDASLFGQC